MALEFYLYTIEIVLNNSILISILYTIIKQPENHGGICSSKSEILEENEL